MAAVIRSPERRLIVLASLVLAGCGGGAPTPTSPAPIPTVPVSVRVAAAPLRATFISNDGNTSKFRVATEITVSVKDSGVHITQVTETISKSQQTEQGLTLSIGLAFSTSVSLHLPPGASLTQPHVAEFGVAPGETVTYTYQVSGVDSEGRSFSASTGGIQVELPAPGSDPGVDG